MKLQIRPAVNKDRGDILTLLCDVFGNDYRDLAENYLSSMFSNNFRKPSFLVATYNNEVIGCAAYTEELFTVNVWGISWVAVKEMYRNKGFGQEIIEECLKEIRERISSPVTILLDTYPSKTRLYDKIGFKILGNDHEDGSFMTLTLNPL